MSAARNQDTEQEQPLFRPQVFAEQRHQWLGRVLLTPSISHTLISSVSLLAAIAVLALLFFGDYTRKERIGGRLMPQQGMVQIYSPMSGYVTEIQVDDGSQVNAGDTLMIVSTELNSEALGATQQEVIKRLQLRRTSLLSEQRLNKQLFDQQQADLESRVVATAEELKQRGREIDVQRERVALAKASSKRLAMANDSGAISNDRWVVAQNERLDQSMRLIELQRIASTTARKQAQEQFQLTALPLEYRKQIAQLDRDVDRLEQELAEAESRRRIVLSAPQAGTVVALQIEAGGDVKPQLPLLSIVPTGSELEARLYIPSRAIGFLEEGQSVLLRYSAFPYQKFGHFEGTISQISRSTVNPAELAPKLRPVASASGTADEPVYPVTVQLQKQNIDAYGRTIALQPGMEFEADVLIENRRLIEWVLEPLYSLTGKVSK